MVCVLIETNRVRAPDANESPVFERQHLYELAIRPAIPASNHKRCIGRCPFLLHEVMTLQAGFLAGFSDSARKHAGKEGPKRI
jgi:hypothetical protein